MNDEVLVIDDLHKHFGRTQVLRGVTLSIPERSIYGFLGPNGAGKTTTMKIVMGLLRASNGRAEIFGNDVRRHGPAARARVGYLPQHPRFHPYRTCLQVLELVGRLHPSGSRGRTLRREAHELLDVVGLSGFGKRRTRGLSGGEAQRLGIAQALIGRPDLLILDEPAAALDPQGRRDVLALLESLRGQATIFYSTHILDDVQRVSDRVAMLSGGRVVADGRLDELLEGGASSWTLRVSGQTEQAQDLVAAQPWVSDISVRRRGTSDLWTVFVTDDQAAADALLPTVLSAGECDVGEFHRSDRTLEDAYLAIVGHDHEAAS